MEYGVLSSGFVKMRLPEIRAAIITDLKARLQAAGLPQDIQTRPDSVLGLLIDTFAEREAALWNVAEGVYNAMYPDTAFGVSLDNAAAFTGVRRLGAAASVADLLIYTDKTLTVPAGTQFRNTATQSIWQTNADVVISPANAVEVRIHATARADFTYWITLNGQRYSYRSGRNPTADDIADGLKTAIPADYTTTREGVFLHIQAASAVQVGISENLRIVEMAGEVPASPLEGAEAAAENTLTEAVTLIDGIKRVSNRAAAAGRTAESDEDLRLRYESGVYALGAATRETILANLRRDIPAARDIYVFENSADTETDGMKPHSIKVLIEGGRDEDIAQAIYRAKAAGIDTNGEIAKTVETDAGDQVIRFARPRYRYIWMQARLTLGRDFPADGYDSIRADLNAAGQKLAVGEDVVLQRFYCGVFKTAGVDAVTFQFAVSDNPTARPSRFEARNIEIAPHERALFDPLRIEVL